MANEIFINLQLICTHVLPVIQKEAVIFIQTVILKFLWIVACTLKEVKNMLGAQQLLHLLIRLFAVTLNGQTGIGIVDAMI